MDMEYLHTPMDDEWRDDERGEQVVHLVARDTYIHNSYNTTLLLSPGFGLQILVSLPTRFTLRHLRYHGKQGDP